MRRSVVSALPVGKMTEEILHAHAGAINAGIPGSRRDIPPGAGHLIPLEQPERFNRVVLGLLLTSP